MADTSSTSTPTRPCFRARKHYPRGTPACAGCSREVKQQKRKEATSSARTAATRLRRRQGHIRTRSQSTIRIRTLRTTSFRLLRAGNHSSLAVGIRMALSHGHPLDLCQQRRRRAGRAIHIPRLQASAWPPQLRYWVSCPSCSLQRVARRGKLSK